MFFSPPSCGNVKSDVFIEIISAYFVCLNFQQHENMKIKINNANVGISRHVLQVGCFPVQNMTSSGSLLAHVSVLHPLTAVVSVSVLRFV